MGLQAVIGVNVRRLRKQAELSQEELAARAEIEMRYLGGIERGEQNPSVKILERIAKALGVHPSVLLLDSERPVKGSKSPR